MTVRSYSPEVETKMLCDEDPDERYMERIAEIGCQMDHCLAYAEDFHNYIVDAKDVNELTGMEQTTEKFLTE